MKGIRLFMMQKSFCSRKRTSTWRFTQEKTLGLNVGTDAYN
jgi:hypothetical protein